MRFLRPKHKPDEQWFETLVHTHIDELTAFAFRLSRNREHAEDLVQETFTEAWNGIAALKKITSARAWLFRVLRRRYARHIRNSTSRPDPIQVGHHTDDIFATIPAPAPDPHTQASSRDYLEKLLATLDDTFRIPLLMATMEGLTVAEIASELGLPAGTVLSRIHRARQHLHTAAAEIDQPSAAVVDLKSTAHERNHHGS